jgi:hypothetical protein
VQGQSTPTLHNRLTQNIYVLIQLDKDQKLFLKNFKKVIKTLSSDQSYGHSLVTFEVTKVYKKA